MPPLESATQRTLHVDRPRQRRQQSESSMSVNLTPAIDITFNLLIFFLVATTFKAAEGILPSDVPQQQGVLQAAPLPVSPIRIRLRQIGAGPGDYRLAVEHWRQVPQTFTDLTLVLRDLIERSGFDRTTPVIIIPDDDVQWDHVVNAFNAVRRANLQSVAFAAKR